MRGHGGNDRMKGGDGSDRLMGERGDDTLEGGNGNDLLRGGAGADTLVGGGGVNTMTGGGGADCFVLQEQSIDVQFASIITDFRAKQGDVLKLKEKLSVDNLWLQTFDFNNDGIVDSTIIQTKDGNGVLAIALGTVNSSGQTTLSNANFV
ncbi:MAG: hypothetical protein Kow00121_23990 [Elainellaceae cyanobacterium]